MNDQYPRLLVDESEDDGKVLEVIFDTIENQVRDGEPPEVAATLARLQGEGHSREQALRYIACALSVEFFEILEHGARFDGERYADNLAALPALPYDEDAI
ncbi:MAG: hypothetical protein K2Y51_25290 [Gammaproteobacteria bacterium]|jgi:hypothetical protein|nr:hypothetical protein [Gammaproteobacteria bacterium]